MSINRDKLEYFVGHLAAEKDRWMREVIATWESDGNQRHSWRRSPKAKLKVLSSYELAKAWWVVNCRWKENNEDANNDLPYTLFKENWNKVGVPRKPFKGRMRLRRIPWRDGEEISLDVFRRHPEWISERAGLCEVADDYAANYAASLYLNRYGGVPNDADIDSLSGKRGHKLHPAKIKALLNALVDLKLIERQSGHSPKKGRGAVYMLAGEPKSRKWMVPKKMFQKKC